MTNIPIPPWNSLGLLLAVDSARPTSLERSPYPVSLQDVVKRFAISPERGDILAGFLDYRAELHRLGLIDGFQWINGSFLEQVEMIEGRSPRDMDVVTFFALPAGKTQRELQARSPLLFDPYHRNVLGDRFHIDAYYQSVDGPPRVLVHASIYWYSLWSHRRDQVWKGFLEVSLTPQDDAEAIRLLKSLPMTGDES